MRAKTTLNTLLAIAVTATLASCVEVGPSIDQIATQAPSVSLTPVSGEGRPSAENNPFTLSLDYDARSSFAMLTDPVYDFRGTIVESYLYDLGIREFDSNDNSVALSRSFGVIGVRDQQNELSYFIYPAEKLFPLGQQVSITRYWQLREDLPLMNNMLVKMITYTDEGDGWLGYHIRLDYPIESPAEDGRFEGIIELGAVDYLSPEGK